MPIYQYICPKCNKKKEVLQKTNDDPPICDKCKVKFEKIISKCSIVFKGPGWSADGYAIKPNVNKNKKIGEAH